MARNRMHANNKKAVMSLLRIDRLLNQGIAAIILEMLLENCDGIGAAMQRPLDLNI